jgi:hypothetical protein
MVNSAQAWDTNLALEPSRPAAMSPQAITHRVYVCIRGTNGYVTSTPCAEFDAASSTLQTFFSTARQMGYRIHPSDDEVPPLLGRRYLGLREHAVLTFWLSETDDAR